MKLFDFFIKKINKCSSNEKDKEWEEFFFNPFIVDETGKAANVKINSHAVTTCRIADIPSIQRGQ